MADILKKAFSLWGIYFLKPSKGYVMKKKTGAFFVLATVVLAVYGCGDGKLTGPKPDLKKDIVSEFYLLEGWKMESRSCWVCDMEEFEQRIIDTTRISFEIEVQWMEGKPDTVGFYGLEGANAGENVVYPPHCVNMEDCMVYAKFTGRKLEFDTGDWGYLYKGTGTLENGIIELKTFHRYRGLRIEYELEGRKQNAPGN